MSQPIKIPRGQMCLHCEYLYRKCGHLPFNTYQPIEKPDDEGYVVVKCADFIKHHREEFA